MLGDNFGHGGQLGVVGDGEHDPAGGLLSDDFLESLGPRDGEGLVPGGLDGAPLVASVQQQLLQLLAALLQLLLLCVQADQSQMEAKRDRLGCGLLNLRFII